MMSPMSPRAAAPTTRRAGVLVLLGTLAFPAEAGAHQRIHQKCFGAE
jgi:hypothetical protein